MIPTDAIRCERWHCTLMARACCERQAIGLCRCQFGATTARAVGITIASRMSRDLQSVSRRAGKGVPRASRQKRGVSVWSPMWGGKGFG